MGSAISDVENRDDVSGVSALGKSVGDIQRAGRSIERWPGRAEPNMGHRGYGQAIRCVDGIALVPVNHGDGVIQLVRHINRIRRRIDRDTDGISSDGYDWGGPR